MDLETKLRILGAAARYDASCASSGSQREAPAGGVGNTSVSGICHSWADDGRCISLLKVLFTNVCRYDCAYCANRRSNDTPRAAFTVEELVDLTVSFYRRNYIEGLFLSSGVAGSPDATMEQLIRVVETLRRERQFGGYIHLKAIPGASAELLWRAGLWVDRLSVNIELPSQASLCRLAPEKGREEILRPMGQIGRFIAASAEERRRSRRAPRYSPAGHSTQMIVGASPESDLQILNLSSALYSHYSLKRVYYSAYMPVGDTRFLPALPQPPLRREHRLYQADWLMRFYQFGADELVDPSAPFLDDHLDPKAAWALRHPAFFPVDLNRADLPALLRVPGIGPASARRILTARRFAAVTYDRLAEIGVVLKRARYFIACPGVPPELRRTQPADVQRQLVAGPGAKYAPDRPLLVPATTMPGTAVSGQPLLPGWPV